MKTVTLTFSFEDEDLEKFIEENGAVEDWVFGEICQNHDFGFLTGCTIRDNGRSRDMTEVNHEYEAEKKEYRRTIGDFDAYVIDAQEKKVECEYQKYVLDSLAMCKVPESFENWILGVESE